MTDPERTCEDRKSGKWQGRNERMNADKEIIMLCSQGQDRTGKKRI